jgi:hypothetical protein
MELSLRVVGHFGHLIFFNSDDRMARKMDVEVVHENSSRSISFLQKGNHSTTKRPVMRSKSNENSVDPAPSQGIDHYTLAPPPSSSSSPRPRVPSSCRADLAPPTLVSSLTLYRTIPSSLSAASMARNPCLHGDISAVLDQALVIVEEMDALILAYQQRP